MPGQGWHPVVLRCGARPQPPVAKGSPAATELEPGAGSGHRLGLRHDPGVCGDKQRVYYVNCKGDTAISNMKNEENVLLELDAYVNEHKLSRRNLAEMLGIPYGTLKPWFTKGKSANKPSKGNLDRIKNFLEDKTSPEREEARHRAEKIKYLLLLLEDELRWFRDNSPDAREMYRRELDPFDIGYISSLLSMLTEEDKFKRWLALTTARFYSFKRR